MTVNIKQLIYTNQVDIIGVQENWTGENKISLNMRWFKFANIKSSQKTGAGIAIIIKESLK